jgi:XTP/dITP diphosphohydrolase
VTEAQRLGFRLERLNLDLSEPQALDAEDVAREKVRMAWERLRRPVLVEDSGLEILAWGGFPGALVKWLEKSAGLETIVRMLEPFPDRRARAVCVIACFDGEQVLTARGATEGAIASAPRGTGGFGWDPIFVPQGSEKTFAELPPAEKDAVSHRGRAWAAMAEKLGSDPRRGSDP